MNGNTPQAGRSVRTEMIVLAAVSLLLYHLGPLLVLFLVPMQLLLLRRGERGFQTGLLLFLGGEVIFKAISLVASRQGVAEPLLVSLDVLLPLSLLAGLYVANRRGLGRLKFGTTAGLLLGALTTGIVSLPLVVYLGSSRTLNDVLSAQFKLAQDMGILPGAGDATNAVSVDSLVKIAIDIFYRFYLFGMFVVLSVGWYWGSRFAARDPRMNVVASEAMPGNARRTGLADVRIAGLALWPLLAGFAGAIVGRFVALGPFVYVFWNVALVCAFLYAIQGIAIISSLLRRAGAGRGVRVAVALAAIVLLFIPVANLVVAAGLPLLGVSETWIRYRRESNESVKE